MQYAIELKKRKGTVGDQPTEILDRTAALGTDSGIQLDDSERTRCEIWTRVMGYHRPVSAFNHGKKAEHAERVCFTEAC